MAAGGGADPFIRLPLGKDSPDDTRDMDKFRINELRVVVVSAAVRPDITDLQKKTPFQASAMVYCCLAVGAGHADDPLEYPGMAHLVEHCFAMHEQTRNPPEPPKSFFYSPENLGYYAYHNDTTLEDITLYKCGVPWNGDQTRKLQHFLSRFSSSDFSDKLIKGEARILSQEYEWRRRGKWDTRFGEVARFFQPKCKALRYFTEGNLASLMRPTRANENNGNQPPPANVNNSAPTGPAWIDESNWDLTDLKKAMQMFIKKHYRLKNCVLVLQGPVPMQDLRILAYNIWNKMTVMLDTDEDQVDGRQQQQQPQQPTSPKPSSSKGKSPIKRPAPTPPAAPPPKKTTNPLDHKPKVPAPEPEPNFYPYVDPAAFYKQFYNVQPVEYYDTLYMNWIVDYGGDEEKYSRVKPLEYISALMRCCKAHTILDTLTKKNYITDVDVLISKSCFADEYYYTPWSRRYKAQMFTIILRLTRKGVNWRKYVIGAVLCYIRHLKADESIYNTLSQLRDRKLQLFGVARQPEKSVSHIACTVLYPEKYNKNILTDSSRMHGFDKKEIKRVLDILGSVDQLNVVMVARLGMDLPEGYNADNQPLGFGFLNRAFKDEELQLWSAAKCKEDQWLRQFALRMPQLVGEIETLDGNPEWAGLLNPVVPSQPRDQTTFHGKASISMDAYKARALFIRVENYRLPFTKIEVQLRPPDYIPSPKMRAYVSLFTEMLVIRAQLVEPTWAQAECSIFQVREQSLGGVLVKMAGLHHFAMRWLVFLLTVMGDPKTAIADLLDAVLESIQKKFLKKIYDHDELCRDLTKRGAITGYAPFVETYKYLIDAAADSQLYTDITSFISQMKITVYARTNTPPTGFAQVQKLLSALPDFKLTPPVGGKAANVGSYYTQLTMKNESPPGMYMISPNKGSHLSSVRLTYLFYNHTPSGNWGMTLGFLQAFLINRINSTLRESLGMTYNGTVQTNASLLFFSPTLEVVVSSDIRWFSGDRIREEVIRILNSCGNVLQAEYTQLKINQMGIMGLNLNDVIAVAQKYLDISSPDCRMYAVQVEGHEDLDMTSPSFKGPTLLDYPEFCQQPAKEGFTNHIGQTAYLLDAMNPRTGSVIEGDLAAVIP